MADSEGGAVNDTLITPLMDFYKDSVNLLRRCTKPDGKGTFRLMSPWFGVSPLLCVDAEV